MRNVPVVKEDISSIVNNMNEEGVNSIEVSFQYRVMNKPVECSLIELKSADGETTIKEFLEEKLISEDFDYDQNQTDPSLYVEGWSEEHTIADVVSDMKETPVDEPVLSVTAEYDAKKEVEVSLQTLNEYKNANPDNTMDHVLQGTLECPYTVEEWEVL
jgi:hypothetical protein